MVTIEATAPNIQRLIDSGLSAKVKCNPPQAEIVPTPAGTSPAIQVYTSGTGIATAEQLVQKVDAILQTIEEKTNFFKPNNQNL